MNDINKTNYITLSVSELKDIIRDTLLNDIDERCMITIFSDKTYITNNYFKNTIIQNKNERTIFTNPKSDRESI